MQVPDTGPRCEQSARQRVDAVIARVTRAASAVRGKSTDAAIDAQLLAALVLAGADAVRARLAELDAERG